jgi:hypothetical protein
MAERPGKRRGGFNRAADRASGLRHSCRAHTKLAVDRRYGGSGSVAAWESGPALRPAEGSGGSSSARY